MEDGRGNRYGYDEEGQLTSASYRVATPEGTPGTALRTDVFEYDKMGNRMGTHNIASQGSTNFTRDNNGLNQYSSWTPSANKGSSNFKDDVKKDKAPVAVSYVDPARLPNNYKLVGGVVGYRLFSPGRAREDIQRAKNAGWRTFIMTAPERKVPVIYDKYTSPHPVF
jgi:hypothetical protein